MNLKLAEGGEVRCHAVEEGRLPPPGATGAVKAARARRDEAEA
jgi:hypothetical protein